MKKKNNAYLHPSMVRLNISFGKKYKRPRSLFMYLLAKQNINPVDFRKRILQEGEQLTAEEWLEQERNRKGRYCLVKRVESWGLLWQKKVQRWRSSSREQNKSNKKESIMKENIDSTDQLSTLKVKIKSLVDIVYVIAESIRRLKTIPSGYLYVCLMRHIDLDTYESIINMLIRIKLIKRHPSDLLEWIGPSDSTNLNGE